MRPTEPKRRRLRLCHGLLVLAVLLAAEPCAAGLPRVAVFNFRMKSDTPEWLWLEKGLADRITTDLFRDRSLNLLDRDRMQRIAEKMRWVPEMMEDRDSMPRLGRFRARYLVSGTYEVADETLTITAQVVKFDTAREVARRTVRGPAEESLGLVRRLSAELLAWFTKREPEAVLEEMPAWTRSIPAAQALYEGVDLYDQGRYAEGWLKFRQASREDPGYTEARYWSGRCTTS